MNHSQKKIFIIIGIVLSLLVLIWVGFNLLGGNQWNHFGMMGPGMMRSGMMGGSELSLFLFLPGAIILGLIVWMLTSIIDTSEKANDNSGQQNTPLEILKRRYARGEIDKEEYKEKKNDLTERKN
jgi:putative membrane protein